MSAHEAALAKAIKAMAAPGRTTRRPSLSGRSAAARASSSSDDIQASGRTTSSRNGYVHAPTTPGRNSAARRKIAPAEASRERSSPAGGRNQTETRLRRRTPSRSGKTSSPWRAGTSLPPTAIGPSRGLTHKVARTDSGVDARRRIVAVAYASDFGPRTPAIVDDVL